MLFDTNAYKAELKDRMGLMGLDYDKVANKAKIQDRTDIGHLFEATSKLIGKEKAETMFFDKMARFCSIEMQKLINKLDQSKVKLLIVTVGDRHQTKKIKGFGIDLIFVVQEDKEKTIIMSKLLNSFSNVFFFDDKKHVVQAMRKAGIQAFQASWFLDPAHQADSLKDSINKPVELLRVCGLD
ncbi:MAG: hypothetical protein GOU99_00610 [Candidatus Altiarchaeota archaeon]|nr:hypothetical protein [Candidatus Altiarchaeota archaeon]